IFDAGQIVSEAGLRPSEVKISHSQNGPQRLTEVIANTAEVEKDIIVAAAAQDEQQVGIGISEAGFDGDAEAGRTGVSAAVIGGAIDGSDANREGAAGGGRADRSEAA